MANSGFSIGGWCGKNRGADPFGDPTRDVPFEVFLEGCVAAGIKLVSYHDRDIWKDDASKRTVTRAINQLLKEMGEYGLEVYNFTTNLFSNSCFRSGGFSSPYPDVRKAAIVKACRAMDIAAQIGAKNMIFWNGRDGTDGCYEQSAGLGAKRTIEGIKTCVDYAIEKGYDYKVTIETKVYEPRLLALYLGTAGAASSAIQKNFPGKKYDGRILINPEYPQHVSMLGLDPWTELGQLLEEGLMAEFMHFGGQIPARMDCDLPPGIGSSLVSDLMLCLLLNQYEWDGIIEFDCRPVRTTTKASGIKLFLRHCVDYWQMLEEKAMVYQNDPIITKIRAVLEQEQEGELDTVTTATRKGVGVVKAVEALTKTFTSFEEVAEIDTDANEALAYRIIQIAAGNYERGAQLFEGTQWAA